MRAPLLPPTRGTVRGAPLALLLLIVGGGAGDGGADLAGGANARQARNDAVVGLGAAVLINAGVDVADSGVAGTPPVILAVGGLRLGRPRGQVLTPSAGHADVALLIDDRGHGLPVTGAAALVALGALVAEPPADADAGASARSAFVSRTVRGAALLDQPPRLRPHPFLLAVCVALCRAVDLADTACLARVARRGWGRRGGGSPGDSGFRILTLGGVVVDRAVVAAAGGLLLAVAIAALGLLAGLGRSVGRGGLAVAEQVVASGDGGVRRVGGAIPLAALALLVDAADTGRLLTAVRAEVLLGLLLGVLVDQDAVFATAVATVAPAPVAVLAVLLLLLLALFALAARLPLCAAHEVRHTARDARQRAPGFVSLAGGAGDLGQAASVLGVGIVVLVDTSTTEDGARGRAGEESAVGALASQDRALVIFPVIVLEVEPAVAGPEEEPDPASHECTPDQAKQHEHARVVHVPEVRRPFMRVILVIWAVDVLIPIVPPQQHRPRRQRP